MRHNINLQRDTRFKDMTPTLNQQLPRLYGSGLPTAWNIPSHFFLSITSSLPQGLTWSQWAHIVMYIVVDRDQATSPGPEEHERSCGRHTSVSSSGKTCSDLIA